MINALFLGIKGAQTPLRASLICNISKCFFILLGGLNLDTDLSTIIQLSIIHYPSQRLSEFGQIELETSKVFYATASLFSRSYILMGLDPDFWATEYHPALEPTRHFHIKYNVVTHVHTMSHEVKDIWQVY